MKSRGIKVLALVCALAMGSMAGGCTLPTGSLEKAEQTGEEALQSVKSFFEENNPLKDLFTEAPSSSVESSSASTASSDDSFSWNPLEWSSEYQDKLPTGKSLFINNAVSYYYKSVLNAEERDIYEALLAIVQDPTSTEYQKRVTVSTNPESDDFSTEVARAYEALIYDHPELFWFRQNSGNFHYTYNKAALGIGGKYAVMFQLTQTYTNYEAEMTAFNQAVQAFLSDIDMTQSQPMIALQIHDKLISLVTYDHDLAAQNTSSNSAYDYGYSAYGALVANSRGQANTAVCDGYSYAYEYLCQQAGLTVTRVAGYAGENTSDMEGHSWNLLCFDNEWYEVDATWDDREDTYDGTDPASAIFAQAQADTAFWNRITHYMFNLTTEEITNYTPDASYTYHAADGSSATFLGPSVHIRDDGSNPSETGDYLSYLAPQATGTKYAYDNLISGATGTSDSSTAPATTSASSETSDSVSDSSADGEDPLLPVDADGDGIPDNSAYRDDDQDGYVDNWQDF